MKIFRGSEQNFLPDLNVCQKKNLYNVCLLSEMQGIIAFTLYIVDPINSIPSEHALINIIARARDRYSNRTILEHRLADNPLRE